MTKVSTDAQERENIVKVLERYVDGARSGRGNEMKSAFHEDATIFGYIGDDLFAGPIQKLFDWNDQNGAAKDLKVDIASIDLNGTIATVRLELDNWTGYRFTDLFTLLKIGDDWTIVNKVFHLHA